MRAAKDILTDYRAAKLRLRAKQDVLEGLICDLTRTTASLSDAGIQQTGPLKDKMERILVDAEAAYEDVVNAAADATEDLAAAMRMIEQAPQERWRLLLTMRFLEGSSWEEIGKALGVTERQAKRIGFDALGVLEAYNARREGFSAEN